MIVGGKIGVVTERWGDKAIGLVDHFDHIHEHKNTNLHFPSTTMSALTRDPPLCCLVSFTVGIGVVSEPENTGNMSRLN